jgi:dTDP-4-amino-4,6-dideoxygalactose transaminase
MKSIPFGKPIIGDEERKAVMEVLNGSILVHGARAKEFESVFSKYTGAGYAVSTSSCTAALHLSYFYYGLGKGDEVIVPAQTHTATAHAVELCGAKPVFVDSEKDTGNIDIDQIESYITERTKAISIVHFLGMPVDMARIIEIAKKYNLFVIEDCALALGSYFNGVHAGLHGDVGCFSFYPVKHMTTAEGGMLITNSEDIAKKITRQKAFGVDRHMGERSIPGVYDVTMLGFNYRLNEIQAAIGIEQMKRLDGFIKKRKENYELLSAGIENINEIGQFLSSHGKYQSSYYCLSILLNDSISSKRFEIVSQLKQKGVGTSVYYPKPVPCLTYYKNKYGYREKDFPVASWISESSIALPVGPHLDKEDMEYIINSVKNTVREVK